MSTPLAKGPDGAPVCKFPASYFEFPAYGEELRHGDFHVRRAAPGPRFPGHIHEPRPMLCDEPGAGGQASAPRPAPRPGRDQPLRRRDEPLFIHSAAASVARWEEFAPIKTVWADNQPTDRKVLDTSSRWGDMPFLMLAKCADAQTIWSRGQPASFNLRHVINFVFVVRYEILAQGLVSCAAGATQSRPVEFENALEMSKQHLNFFRSRRDCRCSGVPARRLTTSRVAPWMLLEILRRG